jgi:hypothetical protein
MSDEALENFDRRFKMGTDRNWARWKDHFEGMVTHAYGAEKNEDDMGREYLTLAGDPASTIERYKEWSQQHGPEMAKTMLTKFWKDGRKYVDKLTADVGNQPDAS